MLWNCGHDLNKKLSVYDVSNRPGSWLHGFEWLPEKDSDIGTIDEEWNWLDGHSDPELKAKNVHFTTGGPWFKNWECKRSIDGQYASEWNGDYTYLAGHGMIQPYEL